MNPKDVFAKALDQATRAIQHLDLELDNPTPYKDWDVRKLLNHMMNELMWVPALLHGKTIKEVGTVHDRDLLGTDPVSAWMHAADSALLSVNHADDKAVVHASHGDVPAAEYIEEIGRDLFIHTWDVGQAMNATVLLEPEVAHAIYDHDISHKDELMQESEFAPALDVPDSARFQAKFLALYGRKEPTAA